MTASVLDRFTVRAATTRDLGTMADNLTEGFATYRAWAPVSWSPPSRLEMLAGLLQRFSEDGSWCLLAHEGHAPAGHVAARPERDADDRPCPGIARLTHLFVRQRFWGTGLARELNALMLEGMAERGFDSARLWTPEGQQRARAFYEHRGWRQTGARDPVNELGLELVEYAIELPAP